MEEGDVRLNPLSDTFLKSKIMKCNGIYLLQESGDSNCLGTCGYFPFETDTVGVTRRHADRYSTNPCNTSSLAGPHAIPDEELQEYKPCRYIQAFPSFQTPGHGLPCRYLLFFA